MAAVYLMAVSPDETSFVYSKKLREHVFFTVCENRGRDVMAAPESEIQLLKVIPSISQKKKFILSQTMSLIFLT